MRHVTDEWRGAARVYIRPEALYAVREDRAVDGPVLASATDSARIGWGRPGELGLVVLAMLGRSVDAVEQPSPQTDLTLRGRAFRKHLVDLAGLDSWEDFAGEAMLISVRRFARSSLRLSPMLHIPDRPWGFLPTGHMVEVEESPDTRRLGEAIESMARSNGFGPPPS